MKFIKCVIDVRPLRLLEDCMAAYQWKTVSQLCGYLAPKLQWRYVRIQQKHPHPQALVAFGPCVASGKTEYFEELMGSRERWIPRQSYPILQCVFADDRRKQWRGPIETVRVKASVTVDWSSSRWSMKE